ncbi:uncharacterized protein LOC126774709 [Nymphalis io]|uniref:uncharacterized protein LOC126774709 n=1 Tax=Inachis io TaxID=171585 RepID=UPI002169BB0F|nr:uncharacterized protein LOC126774709 [Nymphalis io]
MKLKKIFQFIFLCLSFISRLNANLVNLITSFVISEDAPSALLTPELCWSPFETLTLARKLFKENVFLAPSLQTNRSEYFLHQIVLLADLSCPGIELFLIQVSNQGYFKSPYRWLLLDSNVGSYKFNLFNKLDIPLNSDVVIAKKINDKEYQLVEAYKVSVSSDVIYTTRGAWRSSSVEFKNKQISSNLLIEIAGNNTSNVTFSDSEERNRINLKITEYGIMKDYRDTKVISIRRKNLRRHTLTMANVITDSNETRKHLDDRLNLHQDSITKMSYMVVQICFEMLNATEKRIFTHTWGYKDKNGNWQGIIDHLLKKEADLGTLTIFTQERMKAIDYIAMVGSTAVRFVFREPPLALLENIFALPFTTAVWVAIFICVMGCALFLYITSKWEATVGMHPLQLNGTWADVLILIIGAVLQQGCTLEPRYAAGRCVTLLLFVALTILYAAYSANIVVLLRAPSSSVRSLPDLLNSPLKLGASDFEYNRYFFKKLNEPIRKAIYNKKIAPKGKKPNFYTMKEGVDKIRKGLFAFHMELNPGYRLIQETYQEEEKCDLVEIDYINEIDPWLPGQKRSPYKDLFKISFIKIRETGIQSNIHRRLHVGKPKCSGSISTFSSVGITDMYPALIATLYGMLISIVVLILEITYKRLLLLREKRRTQTQLDGSIGDAMLLTISALSQQGRIMLFVVFTALMALYAAYSANIVVLLQAPSNTIKTLEQLAHSKMTIAALDVDYNHFVLKAQKDQLRRLIYKKIEPEIGKGNFYNLNEGVERVRQGLFAFHSLMETVYRRIEETFLETEKCDLVEVDFMNALDPFVPIYKHSPYIELLRVA